MFRKFLLTLAGVFAAMLSYAYSPAIRQIKLDVELLEDGSARVQEFWDVCVASGTEWYLVFGALFGIADKVAKQLKDINPELFTQVVNCDMDTFVLLLLRSNMLSNAILNTSVNYAASQAGQGLGGHSSFGGGGSFSGGGFGGGSR